MASCHLQTLIALTSFFFHFEFPLFYPLYSQIAVIGDFVSAVSHSLPLPLQKDPLVLAGKSDPVSYEVTVFFFYGNPDVHEILCVPFKSRVSVSSSLMESLRSNPTSLQSQILWVPPSHCHPQMGSLM